jgi:hypothetical protein
VSALIYLIYLVPLVRGWNSTGNPTPVLISFTAHLGLPTLALAFLALCLCIVRRETYPAVWWSGLILIAVCACFRSRISVGARAYFLFFMPAAWVLAAHAVDEVAGRLMARPAALAWYGFVGLLLMPHLLSHYVDGSRHDYRAAASVVMEHAHGNTPVILSDDAETISYYLPQDLRRHLVVRTKVTRYPSSEFLSRDARERVDALATFRETAGGACSPSSTIAGSTSSRTFCRVYRNRAGSWQCSLLTRGATKLPAPPRPGFCAWSSFCARVYDDRPHRVPRSSRTIADRGAVWISGAGSRIPHS